MKAKNRVAIALSVVAALMCGTEAQAQRWGNAGHSSKVRVPDDVGREPLEVAKTALSGGDVDRALSVYQDILDRLADKLASTYRAPRSGTETDHILPGDRFSGLRDHVATLIRAIPDGLARYREREGARAAAELTRALLARDEQQLRSIAMRFELTESGPLALAALSDIMFQTGRVTEARLCADRLLAIAGDAAPKPETKAHATLRAAIAHAALEDRDELRGITAGLANGDASLSVTWQGTTRPLSEVVGQLLAAVEKAPKPQELDKTLASFGKPSWQGGAFSRHISDDYNDESFKFGNQYVPNPLISYFPVIPAVSDSAVYFCDGLKVEGLSLMTGLPLWPAVESPPPNAFQGSQHWNLLHEVVLDRGVLYACLEDEPDIRADPNHMIMGFKPIETIAVRKLYAINANTGAVEWTHARPDMARNADERAFLDRISINTPPLVLGDRLYVGATYYFGGFRQWLCAFDRHTGRIVWKTYVGQGQAELNMFGNPVREVVPGYVGESNGLVVYSTNIGVMVAADAITGVPKWVTAYDQEPVPSSDGQRTVRRAPGWTVRRPLFYAGRAIIAPSDSLDAYVFNLETGEAKAIAGARRTQATQFRHVIGIHDDALILAGRKVHAFDLKPVATGEDPRRKWEAPPDGALTVDAMIDGRPAVAGDRLFYTGRGSSGGRRGGLPGYVASIDVRTGRMIEEKQIEGALYRGNIVISPDAIVIAGDSLTVMFDVKEVAKRLETAIARNPDDAALHLRMGQLELQARNFDRAIAGFERARTLAMSGGARGEPVLNAATLALYNLLLELATEPIEVPGLPDSPKERFEKAATYATNQRQHVQVLSRELLWAKKNDKASIVREIASRFLNEFPDERVRVDPETASLMPELTRGGELKAGLLAALIAASSLAEAGQFADAIAMYEQALIRFPDEIVVTAGGASSVWRYAYGRIGEIIRDKGVGTYAAEEKAAEALLEDGRKGNLDALRTLLDRYPNSRNVEAAWLELSRKLREGGKDRDALRAVQRQLARYGSVTSSLLSELARSLESAGAFESARDILLTLRERFGKETMPTESGSVQVARYVDERLSSEQYKAVMGPPPIPEGTIGLSTAWTESPPTSGEEVVLVVPTGRRPKEAESYILVHREGELKALAIENGKTKWSKAARSIGESVRPIWHDGRLLALLDGDFVSLDPATGKEHWRASTSPARPLAIHAAHGKAYLMLRPPLSGWRILVRALDVVTGERLRELELSSASRTSGDQASAAFGSSPLWLLCQLDRQSGAAVVLDGITGDPVFNQTTVSGASMPAVLTANNLLVTQSPQVGNIREINIVARNPKTQQTVWNYKIDRIAERLVLVALTPEIAVLSARFTGSSQGRREILALDLTNGTTKMSIGLKNHDIPLDGLVAGDLLFTKFKTVPDGKLFIRAYDLKKSALLWDSVTYAGSGLTLSVHASKNYAVVRVGLSEGNAEKRTDMVHFFENRTGLLKDSITLQNTLNRPGQADLDIRDRAIALRGGAEVSVRR